MTLTSQRARTLSAVRQRNTALLLNIHRPLRLSSLGLGLLLFLLLLRLLIILTTSAPRPGTPGAISLALLPFLRPIIRHPLDGTTLLRALLPLHRVLSIKLTIAIVVAIDLLLRPVRRVTRFLLLARFLLLRFQTATDMFNSRGFQDRPLARLADNRLDMVLLARFAGRERRHGFLIEPGEDGGGRSSAGLC